MVNATVPAQCHPLGVCDLGGAPLDSRHDYGKLEAFVGQETYCKTSHGSFLWPMAGGCMKSS